MFLSALFCTFATRKSLLFYYMYKGLTTAEAAESRRLHGRNILTPPEKEPLWKQFVQTLTGPLGHFIPGWKDGDSLVFILEIAAMLSIFVSCTEYFGWFGIHSNEGLKVFFEPAGIIAAIVLATGISFFFEMKANREFEILNQVNDEEPVQVYRDGNITSIPKCAVVVGDIIILSTGEEIPADAELLESTSLSIDESTLTGEPICSKTTDENQFDKDATFPSNHVMRGTKVMEGHAVARVFAVGDNTENGKVFVASQVSDDIKTPLDEQFDRLGWVISAVSYIIGLMVFLGRELTYLAPHIDRFYDPEFITYTLQSLMIAVTLVVCSVPEGLPMAVTLSLALSMRRMLKTNNLVRKMHACETMGATTVICTDKTGTLTQNKMQVAEVLFDERHLDLVYKNMAINSTAVIGVDTDGNETLLGNPTEGALLLYLRAQGKDYAALRSTANVLDETPFSTERKYMQTVIADRDAQVCLTKGAPEIVFDMCKSSVFPREEIEKQLLKYQNQGMRTLGFAADDTFLGIVAISDPVRSDVPAAIKECINAGISIKIVTGDTPATAREIGRQIGLWTDNDSENAIITGPEFAALSDARLLKRVNDIKIIARARPMDKKRLVEALQKCGEVVAVTGDGTNDAPALKAAHIGLSMGDGTSVAKEASDITIIDNSFSSIGRAVMWGRSLYQNIQRFIMFQLTVNVAACIVVLAGAFMGTESPLTVTQMLWVNLIMDTFAAMALASLPPSESVMNDKPRNRKAFIITKKMWTSIIGFGVFFSTVLLGLLYFFEHGDITSLTDLPSAMHSLSAHKSPTPYELSLIFTIFVMFQFWNLFNARAFNTHRSAFHLSGCKGFIGIAAAIFFGQILIMTLATDFFNVESIKLIDWLIVIAATSLVIVIGEIARAIEK